VLPVLGLHVLKNTIVNLAADAQQAPMADVV
jgi:hypothetical protein